MKEIKKMLLVEPVLSLQTAIRIGMTRLGWEVELAFDEESGLAKALTQRFDLILVEISQYDKLDGFSLVEKIKEQTVINKTTPLCTVTVHDIPENKEKAYLLGVDAFFEGVFLNEVVIEVDDFIRNRQRSESQMTNSIRVLVVEDTLIAQRIATVQLVQQGCKVEIAEDGVIALEKAMKTQYDLILMDIGLGDGPDGFEVTAQIKEQSDLNKNTPIIALTAHEGSEYEEKAKEYGMSGYFNKPFSLNEARIVVEALKQNSA